VTLTNVAGKSVADAEDALHDQHFKTTVKREASKTVESGLVIGTEPPAETEVQEGRTITLLVSTGPAPVRVPDVVGESLEAAQSTLTNAELDVGTITKRTSQTQSAGTVLAQTPAAGTSLKAGEKVALTVAKAPKEVEVPNVVGAAEAAAAAALKHAGLKSKTEHRATSESSQVGMVLEQTPAAGEHARKNATVTIVVGVLSPQTTSTGTTTTTTTGTTTTPTTTTTTTTTATPPSSE
jgi:eukaryotic-like serine/threonine-protein kinase